LPDDPKDEPLPASGDAEAPSEEASCDKAPADDSPVADEGAAGSFPGVAGDAPPDAADRDAEAAEEDAPGDAGESGSDEGDSGPADEAPDAGGADADDRPVWGPPAARLKDTLRASRDAGDTPPSGSVNETPDNDSWSPPLPFMGTPLRLPAVRVRRPGLLATVLRAGWEELNYPRARVRAGIRRALNRMKERRLVASLLWGTLAGATFILYASGAGVSRGIVAWAVFAAVAVGMIAGGPAALVHAWPAAIVAPLVACAWAGWAFGSGALWLGMATCAGLLVLYFAAAEVAPLVGAAGVAWLVLHLTGLAQSPGALVIAGVVFVLSAACFIAMRKRVTAPIMAACWVLLSGATAARVTWWTLGASAPATWALEPLAGPGGLAACVAGGAFGMALFSWPRRRETRARPVFED